MTTTVRDMEARAATQSAVERMPVLRELVSNLKASGFAFHPNTMLFGVQHLMAQSLGLCWALDALGLTYDRIALAGKAYSTCPSSLGQLSSLGVMVNADRWYDMRRSQSEELVEDIHELARRFDDRRATVLNPSVLILDDGGQTLTRLQTFLPVTTVAAGVEQTASGFWQTGIRSVPIPIVDVGSSAVKRLCEPPIVIEAVLRRVRDRLAAHPPDVRVGIVGLGFIGLNLAKTLIAEGYRLCVYDSRPDAYYQLHDARCRRIHEVIDGTDIIFGCTGSDITRNLMEEIGTRGLCQRSRELVSISSGDDEFFSLKATMIEDRQATGYRVGDIPDIVGDVAGSTFRIARNAFPINFDNTPESAPLEWIQGTICALLAALAQAQQLHLPAGYAPLSERITLDLNFQEWLLRHWRRELPFPLRLKGRAVSPTPRRSVLERLSMSRTNPESVPGAPAFGAWTADLA